MYIISRNQQSPCTFPIGQHYYSYFKIKPPTKQNKTQRRYILGVCNWDLLFIFFIMLGQKR